MRKMNYRGVTLVELMIVVAIISILAALGSMAYGRYITSGKIQRLTAISQDMAQGQERYRSRNNAYFPTSAPLLRTSATPAHLTAFQNLLDFATPILPGVTVETEAWAAGGGCTICVGAGTDFTASGFAVRVRQDMKGDGAPETTVVYTNTMAAPAILNEGE